MITHICDRCGRMIEQGDLRYIAKIQVYAAPGTLEITIDDLHRNHTPEIERLLERCEKLTEEELMQDVYVAFQFDLCHRCQREYTAAPLADAEH